MPDTAQFPVIFGLLKGLLEPFESHFVVKENTDAAYYLETHLIEQYKKPLMFSAIYIKKQYVSYHLFPVYMRPDLITTLSQPLQKRMQGKACFNFAKGLMLTAGAKRLGQQ
ncbi:MAG: hypothetical protein ABI947_20965 [Chloroflexota bacterium]